MDEWEKFNEKSMHRKEDFYSKLSMEDITDSDYNHAERNKKFLKQTFFVNIMICI